MFGTLALVFTLATSSHATRVDDEISALGALARDTYLADHIGHNQSQVADVLRAGIDEIARRLRMLENFVGEADPRRPALGRVRGVLAGAVYSQIEMNLRGAEAARANFEVLRRTITGFMDLEARGTAWRDTPHGRVFESIGERLGELVWLVTEKRGVSRGEMDQTVLALRDFARFVEADDLAEGLARIRAPLEAAFTGSQGEATLPSRTHDAVATAVREFLAVRSRLNAGECEAMLR